jgi:TRAP-type C4-dicarboxylate transport system substrate-binding protein
LAWGENGFRELTNAKRPVRRPEDLEGMKIRVVGAPIFMDTFRAMGAEPVSVNWVEALAAFRDGTVDGQENPVASVIVPYNLWEFHKNITIWHYAIDPLILAVNQKTWEGFDPKDRVILAQAARETMAWNKKEARKGLEGGHEAFSLLKSHGMEVVVLSAQDKEAFKAKTRPVYDKWVREIGPDLIRTAERIIRSTPR